MQTRRWMLLIPFMALAPAAPAQKPALTAEQIIEKNITASGGRAAIEKRQSTYFKGEFEMPAMGVKAPIEFYAKAPNKRLIVVRIEGFGEFLNGFDGQNAWANDPQQGLRSIEGEGLDRVRRDSAYNQEVRWKEIYKQVELLPNAKVEGREAYVLKSTPERGRPVVTYYDAESFLTVRSDSDGEDGATIESYLSDYRDVDGTKFPFSVRQVSSAGEMLTKIAEVKFNPAMDDVQFAKPKK
jgi:hypothetical protein